MSFTYITNGKIVRPNSIVCGKFLKFNNNSGKICGITNKLPSDADVIDARGNFVAPGLVDIHIHGYLGEDVSDANPDGIKRIARGIAQNGVTSFLPTTMTIPNDKLLSVLNVVRTLKEESKTWDGAEILGVHLEGPFINPSKKGAQSIDNILTPNANLILENDDIISSITLAPEMDKEHKCIKTLKSKSSVVISMGHTDANFEQATLAIENGVTHATHLFNAMSPLTHKNPGVVGAALTSNNVTVEIIADDFHVNPALYSMVAKIKGDKMALITDCTRAGGMPDGEYSLGGQPIFLSGIECRLADGTIAGSVLKLNNAIRNVLNSTNLPLYEVFKMASLTPAKIIHQDNRIGSLEKGKDANIIIVDSNINVLTTIKNGKIIYNS